MAESNKEIHIVFQVLNFLCGAVSEPYNLSSDEKFLLIVLARHKGAKGIYPSIPTLCRELQRHRTTVINSLKRLEEKNLILIDKNSGKSNHYELCTGSSVYATRSVDTTGSVDTTTPVVSTLTTRSVDTTLSIKSISKDKIIERARKKPAPLSLDFLPDQKTKDEIKALGFSKEEASDIGDAFMEYFLDSGEPRKNWQFEARKWFRRERDMIDKKSNKVSSPQPTPYRSTIDTRQPEPEQKFTEPARCKEFMKEILGKMNGKGGRSHGILGNVTGDEKAN